MKTIITDLQSGNKVAQGKAFITLFAVVAAVIAILQITGFIHLS